MTLKSANERQTDDVAAGLRALRRLEPSGLSPDGVSWQQRKSAQTRIAILEATIDSLEQFGYAATTTQTIGELAGISRGAMMHHYSSKLHLVNAVISYTFYKRMEWIIGRIGALTVEERTQKLIGVQILWESYLTREYNAYTELSVAARTDAELRALFLPKAEQFDRIYVEEIVALNPDYPPNLPFELLNDFARAALEGLANNIRVWGPSRVEAVRKLQDFLITKIRQGEVQLPQAMVKGNPSKGSAKPRSTRSRTKD